jgi:hypothetical protein
MHIAAADPTTPDPQDHPIWRAVGRAQIIANRHPSALDEEDALHRRCTKGAEITMKITPRGRRRA